MLRFHGCRERSGEVGKGRERSGKVGKGRPASAWCDTRQMASLINVQQQQRRAAPAPCGVRGHAAGFALAVAFWFALALLAAQTLGLLHGILHSPAAAGAASAYESSSQQHAAAAEEGVIPGGSGSGDNRSASFLTQLFSGHLGDADCRAYDQLSQVDAVPGCLVLVLPLVLTSFLLSTLTGLATARWHALFQARGPPSLR